MAIDWFEKLRVYRLAFEAAMRIFGISKEWPQEERYALTDQVRRSSRSVCANISEAWRKRRYERHFVSKLSDAEAAETRAWLRFAHRCGYLSDSDFDVLDQTYDRICGGLVIMMQRPEKWCGSSRHVREDTFEYSLAP